jgi:hypothetical protein
MQGGEKMKRKLLAVAFVFLLGFSFSAVYAGDTKVGGHVKMVIFDAVDGVNTGQGVKTGGTEFMGFGFGELILYFSQQLNETFSVEFQPSFRASSGATPQLGKKIGSQIAVTSPSFGGFDRALVKYLAPMGVEISAGIVKPKFTMDYGQELFWDEEYNGSKFSADPWLGEMDDAGIEIYKSFSVGDASIPVWLYALNGYGGTDYADNNRQPSAMIHLEPEMGMFKLSGSYTIGQYDADKHNTYQRLSGGLVFNWEGLQVRGEYASGKWENKMGAGLDAVSQGWYGKAIYKFFPWLKLVYNYNVAALNFNGFFYTANQGGEKYITNSLTVDLSVTDSAYLMLQIDYADWMQNNGMDGLNFIRPTIATRVTF